MSEGSLRLLLVDDDTLDIMSIERYIKKNEMSAIVSKASNGKEALEQLRLTEQLNHLVILLDINMPIMNGIEFLQHLRSDTKLKDLPVIILTASDGDKDIADAYKYNAAGYFVKPLEYRNMEIILRKIFGYWITSHKPWPKYEVLE